MKPLTTEEIYQARRILSERSQLSFTQRFFPVREGSPFVTSAHHRVIAEQLDHVISGDITRLIINIPPGYTKTQFVVDFVARGLGVNPGARFIYTSYADTLALDSSRQIKDTVSSEEYARLWPGIHLRADTQAKGLWRTQQGGGVLATSSGGAITGFRAGTMDEGFTGAFLIDDPLKPDDASSKTKREHINGRWDTTFKSRLAREDVPVIIIMQRLHIDDFTGFLLKGGAGCKWHHLWLPIETNCDAEYPAEYTHGIPVKHDLPNGPLWPAKHGPADIARLKLDPFTFSGQYGQRPVPEGGALFKSETLKGYSDLPNCEYRSIYFDGAQKTKERNDYSVMQLWGKLRGGPGAYLIDQLRGKWEEPELIEIAKGFWSKHIGDDQHRQHYGALREFAIEDKSSGTTLIQFLGRAGIPVRAIQRGRDKVTRARDATPHMALGHVHYPKHAVWWPEFEAELLAFPEGAHDDQVDPMMDAIEDMCGGSSYTWANL